MYGTPPTCALILGIGKGVESTKLGFLAKIHTQLVGLVAWHVPKTHQGTHQRSYHNVIF